MLGAFKNLAEALQGGPEDDDEELEDDGGSVEEPLWPVKAGDESHLGSWGVASVLTATVKAKTSQVLTAVQETDWRAELEAFQQGAKEDAEAVGKGADIVMHKAKEAAEQLPTTLEHLPGSAATLHARAEAAGVQAGRSLAGLAGLGSKLVLGTHDLLEQISHAVQNEMTLVDDSGNAARSASSSKAVAGQPRYNRFEADVAAMQRDSSTYCDEPDDVEEYESWLAGFNLVAHKLDVDSLIAENSFMSELQARIVPLIVEYDAFWTRYFYRLHKLEQKHQHFLQLAQRAQQAEEEVGWSSEEEGASCQAAHGVEGGALAAATPTVGLPDVHDGGPNEDGMGGSARTQLTTAAALLDPQGTGVRHAVSGSDDSAAATFSSDSDHWQMVGPTQHALAAAIGRAHQEAGAAPAVGPSTAAGQAGGPACLTAAAAAAQSFRKSGEEGDELSDWGDDDEAALDAAASTADADEGRGSGSDWE